MVERDRNNAALSLQDLSVPKKSGFGTAFVITAASLLGAVMPGNHREAFAGDKPANSKNVNQKGIGNIVLKLSDGPMVSILPLPSSTTATRSLVFSFASRIFEEPLSYRDGLEVSWVVREDKTSSLNESLGYVSIFPRKEGESFEQFLVRYVGKVEEVGSGKKKERIVKEVGEIEKDSVVARNETLIGRPSAPSQDYKSIDGLDQKGLKLLKSLDAWIVSYNSSGNSGVGSGASKPLGVREFLFDAGHENVGRILITDVFGYRHAATFLNAGSLLVGAADKPVPRGQLKTDYFKFNTLFPGEQVDTICGEVPASLMALGLVREHMASRLGANRALWRATNSGVDSEDPKDLKAELVLTETAKGSGSILAKAEEFRAGCKENASGPVDVSAVDNKAFKALEGYFVSCSVTDGGDKFKIFKAFFRIPGDNPGMNDYEFTLKVRRVAGDEKSLLIVEKGFIDLCEGSHGWTVDFPK